MVALHLLRKKLMLNCIHHRITKTKRIPNETNKNPECEATEGRKIREWVYVMHVDRARMRDSG